MPKVLQKEPQGQAQRLERWGNKYPQLCEWMEENLGKPFTCYRMPLQHHKHLKSTNMLARIHDEITRRTRVVRIFPDGASCLRLVRALTAETLAGWLEASRYLDRELLKEHQKLRVNLPALRVAAPGRLQRALRGPSSAALRGSMQQLGRKEPVCLYQVAKLDIHNSKVLTFHGREVFGF